MGEKERRGEERKRGREETRRDEEREPTRVGLDQGMSDASASWANFDGHCAQCTVFCTVPTGKIVVRLKLKGNCNSDSPAPAPAILEPWYCVHGRVLESTALMTNYPSSEPVQQQQYLDDSYVRFQSIASQLSVIILYSTSSLDMMTPGDFKWTCSVHLPFRAAVAGSPPPPLRHGLQETRLTSR